MSTITNFGTDIVAWVSFAGALFFTFLVGRSLLKIYDLFADVDNGDVWENYTPGQLIMKVVWLAAPAALCFFLFFTAYGPGEPAKNTYTGTGGDGVTETQKQQEQLRPDAAPAPTPEWEKDYDQIQKETDKALQDKLKQYQPDGGTK